MTDQLEAEKRNRQVPRVCRGHTRPVVHLTYSPKTEEGVFLFTASKDGQPMLLDGSNGDWVGTFEGHKGAIWGIAVDRTSKLAATASADFSAKLWNATTGALLYSFEHKHIVRSVVFSPDSMKLATAGQEKLVRVYDLANVQSEPLVFEGHTKTIKCLVWSADGTKLLSAGEDGLVIVWDAAAAASGTVSRTTTLEIGAPVTDMSQTLDGRFFIVCAGQAVYFYDVNSLEQAHKFEMNFDTYSADLCPEGHLMLVGGNDLWLRVFEFPSGKILELHKGHHGPIHVVRYHPDGKSYCSGSEDGTIRVWQTDADKLYEQFCQDREANNPHVTFAVPGSSPPSSSTLSTSTPTRSYSLQNARSNRSAEKPPRQQQQSQPQSGGENDNAYSGSGGGGNSGAFRPRVSSAPSQNNRQRRSSSGGSPGLNDGSSSNNNNNNNHHHHNNSHKDNNNSNNNNRNANAQQQRRVSNGSPSHGGSGNNNNNNNINNENKKQKGGHHGHGSHSHSHSPSSHSHHEGGNGSSGNTGTVANISPIHSANISVHHGGSPSSTGGDAQQQHQQPVRRKSNANNNSNNNTSSDQQHQQIRQDSTVTAVA